jgi:hypothetical protein
MATTSNRSWPTPDDTDLVRDGAAAIRALGNAIDGSVGQGFVYAGTRYYTSSGSFLKADPLGGGDIGLRAIRVRLVGGGGGGGGCGTTGGNRTRIGISGGGGVYAEKFITDIASLDSSVTVVRGAGGTAAANANGGTGGTSSFSGPTTFCSAEGGLGGGAGLNFQPINASEGVGPATTGIGDLVIPGEGSEAVQAVSNAVAVNSKGGSSALGAGGGTVRTTDGVNGLPGQLYGGGGSGGVNTQDQATLRSGGAGANGIVIVDCFV